MESHGPSVGVRPSGSETSSPAPILAVKDLTLRLGHTALVEDVSFAIHAGEMVGLVGESGSGKSLTALAIMRLLSPPISIAAGSIDFCGRDLAALAPEALRKIRGNEIAMIFQEPMTSLNPVFTVGDQIAEVLVLHRALSHRKALARAVELIDLVGIPGATRQAGRYPHQLSGGQRQRIMIAMALACEPKLLIADEPTTALDVTIEAQILALIDDFSRRLGLACLLITHDLGVVGEVCDRAMVMYAGRIVEAGPVDAVLARPRHRYTRALVDTIPANNKPGRPLPSIAGMVPAPGDRGAGCAFVDRCPAALPFCRKDRPVAQEFDGRTLHCWSPAS